MRVGRQKLSALFVVDAGKLFQAQAVEGDETGGVVLVVGFLLATFHSGDILVIKAVRRTASGIDNVSFVKLEPDFAPSG